MGSRYNDICKWYFGNIITCLNKNLPDLTHLSFWNRTSAGLAKWNELKNNKLNKSSNCGWNDLRIAQTSHQHHDCVTKWSAVILILIPFNITSDEVYTSKRKCCLLLVSAPPIWRMAAVSCLRDICLIWNCSWWSWNHVFMVSAETVAKIHEQRNTQKCEKTMKNSWKGREKLVKRLWKSSTCG